MTRSKLSPSQVARLLGTIIIVLGAIFVCFAIAPAVVPGGVPTGPLEFGGKGIQSINGLELLLGASIMVAGFSFRKFAQRHVAILAGGVVLVLFLSVIAVLSSLNSTLTLTSIDMTFHYGSNDQGYFGTTQQTFPMVVINQKGNLTVDEGSSFKVSFALNESSLARGSDGIAQIRATTEIPGFTFQVTSASPVLPVVFTPGSTIRINVTLNAPFYSAGQSCPRQYCLHGEYVGPINLLLTTTDGYV